MTEIPAEDDTRQPRAGTPRLNAALARVQADVPRIAENEKADIPGKDGKRGYSYDYAGLTAVTDSILPLLGRNGLAFTAWPTLNADGKFVMEYSLLHESGEQRDGVWPLASSARPQDIGGLITYYRRYALCAVTGIAPGGGDDDAASANVTQQFDRPRSAAEAFESAPPRPAVPDEDDGDNGDWLDGIDGQADADKADAALRKAFAEGVIGATKARRLRNAIQERARELALLDAPKGARAADAQTAELAAAAVAATTLAELRKVNDDARAARKMTGSFMHDGEAVTIQSYIAAKRRTLEAAEQQMAGAPGVNVLERTIKLVREDDAARPRSLQEEPGWSEVGGCRSALGFRLSGAWATDDPDNWAAIRGTAIHKHLETVLSGEPGYRTELDTSYRGIPGHADLLVIDEDGVVDFKTTKLSNSLVWREKPSARWQKRVQAHGYAAGLIEAGELTEDCRVALMVIPVDGTFEDWWLFEEPFDRSLADEGADRVEWVRDRLAAGLDLPRDEPYAFCEKWCRFFSSCRAGDDAGAAEEITDPELAGAIAAYGEATAAESAARKAKDRLAPVIRGMRGTTADGWRVSTGRGGEPGTSLDEEWIRADYASRGEPVPEVRTLGSRPRLTVTRAKGRGAAA